MALTERIEQRWPGRLDSLRGDVFNGLLPVFRFVAAHDRPARLLNRAMAPFNPFDPRRWVDPYPLYDELRAEGPVFHHRRAAAWLITGHAEIEHALRAPSSVDRFDVMTKISPFKHIDREWLELLSTMLLMTDPPDHTRLRKLVSRAFTPRAVAALEPEVEKVAGELLDDLATQSQFDAMETYASRLPIYMIGELLGLPSSGWGRLKELSDQLAHLTDAIIGFDPAEMQAALGEVRDVFRVEFEARRVAPRDDLLSALVAAEEDGDRLSDDELLSMCLLLMVAGHETTTGLIGNSLVALDRDRAARRQLLDDPSLATSAVEELLRYDSPVQGTDRIVTEPLEIDGQVIPAGSLMLALLGAGNRDPRMYDAPNELRLDRPDPRPLSFGHGIHHCVGAALARLEAKVAIPAFLERYPDFRVDESALVWKRSPALRGPTHLPITV